MDQDIEPGTQAIAEALTNLHPRCLEVLARNAAIADGQVQPLHVARSHGFAESRHLEPFEFVRLNERHHDGSIPVRNRVEI
jgi:hypothetical protein